jgi:catechol 2,3-dioxygenase-like lactoylglutathione lyase family enzyme
MELHRGRLIDHVHLLVTDIEESKRFYRAVLNAVGRNLTGEGDDYFFADELFVSKADGQTSRVHLAFQAEDLAAVKRFYEAGLAAGGRDNGSPGERHYHPGYYAAYLFDPDGNNIEAVYHGPVQRSTQSVVIVPGDER